jgi:hypothetical protein
VEYALENFQAKWIPVRVKKMRQNKNLEPRSDSIGTETALAASAKTGFTRASFAEAVFALVKPRYWGYTAGRARSCRFADIGMARAHFQAKRTAQRFRKKNGFA